MKQCEGDRLLIGVYVNELVITGSNSGLTSEFNKKLFEMTDLGLLFSYLDINVIQDEDQICLN